MNEDQFPTIDDALAVLKELSEAGFGELPVQIMLVPDSTLQALTRSYGKSSSAAIMIGFTAKEGRHQFDLMPADRMVGKEQGNTSVQ